MHFEHGQYAGRNKHKINKKIKLVTNMQVVNKHKGGQTSDGEEEKDVEGHLVRCQSDGAIGH
jgi:hypothetical protein